MRTLPQIVVAGERIGGHEDFWMREDSGKLDVLLDRDPCQTAYI